MNFSGFSTEDNGLKFPINVDVIQQSNFFSKNEIIFYSDLSNLSEQIQKFAKDDNLRKKIARNGKTKYMKHVSSTLNHIFFI